MNATFLTLWGLLAGRKARLKLWALVILYSGNPAGTFYTIFNFSIIPLNKHHSIKQVTLFSPFGGCWQGESHLKLLAYFIPYPENPKVTFGTVFSLGAIPINKCTFCPL